MATVIYFDADDGASKPPDPVLTPTTDSESATRLLRTKRTRSHRATYLGESTYDDDSSVAMTEEDDDPRDERDKYVESCVSLEVPTKRPKTFVTEGIYYESESNGHDASEGFSARASHKYSRSRRPPVMPLPIMDGLQLLNKYRPFKLPYNIYCPSEHIPKVPGWRPLKKNVSVDVPNPTIGASAANEDQRPMCNCKYWCGENCLNRVLQCECDQATCPLGNVDCGNRALQKLSKDLSRGRAYAKGFEVFPTPNNERGFGLKAVRSYLPRELIVEYTGEVISQAEMQSRLKSEYKGTKNFYFLSLGKGLVIDSGMRGSAARFVNHSCDPNSQMQKWYVNGHPRIGLFAGSQGIAAGTEITYDYNFAWFENSVPQQCRCGSTNCRGIISKRASPPNGANTSTPPIAKANTTRLKPIKISVPVAKAVSVPRSTRASVLKKPGVVMPNQQRKALRSHPLRRMTRKAISDEPKGSTRFTRSTAGKSGDLVKESPDSSMPLGNDLAISKRKRTRSTAGLEPTPDTTVVVKRPRGRPRLNKPVVVTGHRPVGRPPRVPKILDTQESVPSKSPAQPASSLPPSISSAVSSASGKKRGRPKKPVSELKVYKKTGRPRGRPKKSSIPVDEELLVQVPTKLRLRSARVPAREKVDSSWVEGSDSEDSASSPTPTANVENEDSNQTPEVADTLVNMSFNSRGSDAAAANQQSIYSSSPYNRPVQYQPVRPLRMRPMQPMQPIPQTYDQSASQHSPSHFSSPHYDPSVQFHPSAVSSPVPYNAASLQYPQHEQQMLTGSSMGGRVPSPEHEPEQSNPNNPAPLRVFIHYSYDNPYESPKPVRRHSPPYTSEHPTAPHVPLHKIRDRPLVSFPPNYQAPLMSPATPPASVALQPQYSYTVPQYPPNQYFGPQVSAYQPYYGYPGAVGPVPPDRGYLYSYGGAPNPVYNGPPNHPGFVASSTPSTSASLQTSPETSRLRLPSIDSFDKSRSQDQQQGQNPNKEDGTVRSNQSTTAWRSIVGI